MVKLLETYRWEVDVIREKQIQKWIDSYNRNGYLHGSILIAHNGTILLNQGFGMANWEHRIPNTSTTKYRIGSLTKAFTAMGVLQLHERQKLDINHPISRYLPDYPNGERITIYQCLTNTSGIPNYTSFPDFWARTMRLPSTLDQLIQSFKDLELDFEPGSRFGYSNSGYALLTAIIEKVSGFTYSEYIRTHICEPLGMYDTGCDYGIRIVPEMASGYTFWEEPIHPAFADLSFPLGSYGLYSTTEDLYIWDQALQSSQLLNKDLLKLMCTPYHNSYACGWMVSEMLGRTCLHHFGDISGYCSNFLRFVDDQVTILFLSNMNVTPVTHLSRELSKIMFGEAVTLPLPALPVEFQKTDSIVGQYRFGNEANHGFDISNHNGGVYLTVPKMYGVPYRFKLIPVNQTSSKSTFVTEMVHEQLDFHWSKGELEYVVYTDYEGKNRFAYKDSGKHCT